jgi:NAD(P)-dependent dehydrogenase (short-subunit alcohol dehydrogenase family)
MVRITVTGVPDPTGAAITSTLEGRATLDTTVAGTGDQPQKAFLDVTQADWDATVAAIRDAFLATRAAAIRGDRRILLISSAPAVRPVHGASLAATAGAFLHTIGQVAAVELGPTGTTVNVIAPGFVGDTRFDAGVPLGRAPSAQDVAGVCAFLASEAAAYVSGAILPVDGAFTVTKSEGGSPITT